MWSSACPTRCGRVDRLCTRGVQLLPGEVCRCSGWNKPRCPAHARRSQWTAYRCVGRCGGAHLHGVISAVVDQSAQDGVGTGCPQRGPLPSRGGQAAQHPDDACKSANALICNPAATQSRHRPKPWQPSLPAQAYHMLGQQLNTRCYIYVYCNTLTGVSSAPWVSSTLPQDLRTDSSAPSPPAASKAAWHAGHAPASVASSATVRSARAVSTSAATIRKAAGKKPAVGYREEP